MSWDYRVVRSEYPGAAGLFCLAIHEAYYDEGESEPHSITANACAVNCDEEDDGVEGLRWMLEQMLKALDRPIVEMADIEAREGKETPDAQA